VVERRDDGLASCLVEASSETVIATSASRSARRCHTLRYLCLHRADVIVRPDGYATLDVGPTPAVADRFKRLDRLLAA
jgi:hypothetical protein